MQGIPGATLQISVSARTSARARSTLTLAVGGWIVSPSGAPPKFVANVTLKEQQLSTNWTTLTASFVNPPGDSLGLLYAHMQSDRPSSIWLDDFDVRVKTVS